jgi:KUP system potassium uptake protein
METPDVPAVLRALGQQSGNGRPVATAPGSTTFYLGRETLIAPDGRQRRSAPAGSPGRMARWRKRLFIVMSRNAQSATAFFSLPPNRVVELGTQIQF